MAVKLQAKNVGTISAISEIVLEILGVQVCSISQKLVLSLYIGKLTQTKDILLAIM